MTMSVPTDARGASAGRPAGGFVVRPTHLAMLVEQVEQKSRSRVIAVQVPGPWAGGGELRVGDQRWQVVRAGSALAIREALIRHEAAGPDARLVLLTPLGTQDLGWDVLARIARQRVEMLDSWELLRDLFRARSVDPRVARLGWLADVLLEHAPAGGYAPAPTGVLDLETVWTHALAGLLGLHGGGAPDALTILRWSTRDGAPARWGAMPAEVRAGIAERLGETAGPLGHLFAGALSADRGEQLVALGLACGVLWPDEGDQEAVLREVLVAARVRLEPLVGGAAPNEHVAREWAALARRLLTELPADRAATQRTRAERLLEELRAEAAAELSRVLPAGAAMRAARFGRAIAAWLSAGGDLEPVEGAHQRFVEHQDVQGTAREERATMAMRLVRALAAASSGGTSPADGGFAALVRQHVRSWSWKDAARGALMAGDVDGELSSAYAALCRRARERREVESQRFAERLAAWNTRPAAEPDLVPVERILEQVVAPVAEARPVLVVLVDGLDLVVWRQLHAELAARAWTWWRPDGTSIAPVGIAMLPSVTAFSRASLFAGRPTAGTQSDEHALFQAHPALLRSVTAGRRPMLVHKGELGGPNGLAPDVRRAIADRQQRVVGAVVNAVDDWLDRSDQVTPRWSIGAIPLLDALLQEAALAERVVVILSDHGHILDHNTTPARGGESARWRTQDGGGAGVGEVVVAGARVRAVTGHDEVILAWSESLRYTGKKTGYHGGASPQEVIAPIAVVSRDELGVEGWRPVLDAPPPWWGALEPIGAVPERPLHEHPATVRRASPERIPQESTVAASPVAWVDGVLASPVYASQRALAGRTAPRDAQIRALLETLDRYHGRAPRAAVASALGLSDMRVRGVLAGARRVLNVEGFAVLEEEDATGTVLLNRDLLRIQFGLSE